MPDTPNPPRSTEMPTPPSRLRGAASTHWSAESPETAGETPRIYASRYQNSVIVSRPATELPDAEVTEWDGIPFENGSHVLASAVGDQVVLSVMNSEGAEVLVSLEYGAAKVIAAVLDGLAADAFRNGHAAWKARSAATETDPF